MISDSKQRHDETNKVHKKSMNSTILKHSLHRKYVYTAGELAHASSLGR
jgi:hypothetical protein